MGARRRALARLLRAARELGGDGGIRTLDRALQPYNGLANRRLQPLGHVSPKERKDAPPREICPTRPAKASAAKLGKTPQGLCAAATCESRPQKKVLRGSS